MFFAVNALAAACLSFYSKIVSLSVAISAAFLCRGVVEWRGGGGGLFIQQIYVFPSLC
jgi:hypothetical protein